MEPTAITTSGAHSFLFNVNKPAIGAGGPTIMAIRFSPSTGGMGNLPNGATTFMKNWYEYISHWVPETRVTQVCEERDTYRFGFNGMEKDNEAKGLGNSLDFGERIYDSRLGRFPTPDPLASKFPSQSPYVFAGNSPILNVDKKGLRKETYNVIIDERNGGKTLIEKKTSSGLMQGRTYTSYYDGITNRDWHDYKVFNVTTINKDGAASTKTTVQLGAFRTNTVLPFETYAKVKVNDYAAKEQGARDGIILTTSKAIWPGNDNNLNKDGRGQFVNVDAISTAFGIASSASNASLPSNLLEGLGTTKDVVGVMDGLQDTAPIDVDPTGNPDYCKNCGRLYDGVGKHQHEISPSDAAGKDVDTIDYTQHK